MKSQTGRYMTRLTFSHPDAQSVEEAQQEAERLIEAAGLPIVGGHTVLMPEDEPVEEFHYGSSAPYRNRAATGEISSMPSSSGGAISGRSTAQVH